MKMVEIGDVEEWDNLQWEVVKVSPMWDLKGNPSKDRFFVIAKRILKDGSLGRESIHWDTWFPSHITRRRH